MTGHPSEAEGRTPTALDLVVDAMIDLDTPGGLLIGSARRRLREAIELLRPLAARSPAPSDVLKHPDQFLVRIERPGGVRFMEATAPSLDEAAEGVGLQRRAAPSVEARDADLESAIALLRHFDYGALADRLASRIASLLPPEKP